MNIREFIFARRWTSPLHKIFPEEVLAKMTPVEPPEAVRLYSESRKWLEGQGLSTKVYPKIAKHSADVANELGRDWLRVQWPDLTTAVVVSWGHQWALRTTWEVFTTYWDDFCYPSSDDVLVWAESETWALFYHHEERFEFGSNP